MSKSSDSEINKNLHIKNNKEKEETMSVDITEEEEEEEEEQSSSNDNQQRILQELADDMPYLIQAYKHQEALWDEKYFFCKIVSPDTVGKAFMLTLALGLILFGFTIYVSRKTTPALFNELESDPYYFSVFWILVGFIFSNALLALGLYLTWIFGERRIDYGNEVKTPVVVCKRQNSVTKDKAM